MAAAFMCLLNNLKTVRGTPNKDRIVLCTGMFWEIWDN